MCNNRLLCKKKKKKKERNFLLYHLAILVGQHLEKNIGTYLNLVLQSYKQFLGQRL